MSQATHISPELRRADVRCMTLAARQAWRGFGRVAPNPMVGCVLVRPPTAAALAQGQDDSRVIALGHHRVFGSLHAEREALADCARRGEPGSARGCTAYVTLEPCNGHAKQPPCVRALIEAGIARVVYAQPDPSENKGGGHRALEEASIRVDRLDHPDAARTSAPWRKHRATGLPWVIVKWAQTIDAKVASRTGDSKWISDDLSRRWVHALRARADAVLTGVGTVLADDPLLTPRGVSVPRPIPRLARLSKRRIVLDSTLRTPVHSRLVRSLTDDPAAGTVTLLCVGGPAGEADADPELLARAGALRAAGASVVFLPGGGHFASNSGSSSSSRPQHSSPMGRSRVPLLGALKWLAASPDPSGPSHTGGLGVQTLLVEAGPRVVGQLMDLRLVDEVLTFTGPVALGDALAPGPTNATGSPGADRLVATIQEARAAEPWRLAWTRRVTGGLDAMTLWQSTRWMESAGAVR